MAKALARGIAGEDRLFVFSGVSKALAKNKKARPNERMINDSLDGIDNFITL